MFLRCSTRKKDGKEHRYYSIVENKRVADGRVVQRHVLYLGEINTSQELAWRKSIDVFEDGQERPSTLALFPEDRCEAVIPNKSVVRVRLSELRLCGARQWGACWLVVKLGTAGWPLLVLNFQKARNSKSQTPNSKSQTPNPNRILALLFRISL